MLKPKLISISKYTLLIFTLLIPALSFGFWQKYKTYTPTPSSNQERIVNNDGFADDVEEESNTDPLDPASKPVDTDSDGIPDDQDKDDDNDGFADDVEEESNTDPLDPASKPVKKESKLHEKIVTEIKNEIRKYGCEFAYNKYIIEKEVPKAYPASHNWNEMSKFNIEEFESLIYGCRKDK